MSTPGRDPERGRRGGRLDALVGGQVEHLAQGRLARRAEQHRAAEDAERAEVAEQREVVVGRLAEPEARVDDRGVPRRRRRRARGRSPAGGPRRPRRRRSGSAPPRGCASATIGTPRAAASRTMPGSSATPQMSLSRCAPASRAAAATAGLVVSIDSGVAGSAPATARMTGTTRAISSSGSSRAWPGRLEAPPMSSRSAPSSTIRRAWATAAATGSSAAEEPVPRERVRRDVEHAHHERPGAPVERHRDPRAAAPGRRAGRPTRRRAGHTTASRRRHRRRDARRRRRARGAGRGRSCRYRIAQERVVDQPRPRLADEVQRPGDDDRAVAGPERLVERGGRRLDGAHVHRSARARPARPPGRPRAPPARARAARPRPCTRRSPRRAPATAAIARTVAAMSLSAIAAQTSGQAVRGAGTGRGRRAPGRAHGPRPRCARRRAAPRGPSTLEQLEPARPARGRVAAPPGVGRDRGEAGGLERVEQAVRDRDVGRLVPAAQRRSSTGAEPGQLDAQRIPVPAEDRRRPAHRRAARRAGRTAGA